MTTTNSDEQLKSILERINRLENDKKELGEDLKEIYAEAKGDGYNPAAIRVIVRKQRQDAAKAAALEADVEVMMAALGMLS